jgi:branched-chain amino acid transport system ATP-binding protein
LIMKAAYPDALAPSKLVPSVTSMPPPLLAAAGLHTYYGQSHVLRGVDLTIDAGEAVGLMGRNGMGKTTLIRTLVGLLRPRAGSVSIRGEPVTGTAPHEIGRRGLAYVPEGRGIFPNLDVREHLLVAARAGAGGRRDWSYERVLGLFPRLGERIHHRGDQLSGGEQQMLSIGRALMTNPDLLILDEATEGLAPLMAQEIWRVIGELRKSGIATLVVDKNHATVTAMTDKDVLLVKGEVVFAGTSAELRERPDLVRRHLGV